VNAPQITPVLIAALAAHAAAGPTIDYVFSSAYVRADDDLIEGYVEDHFAGAGFFLITADQGAQSAMAQGTPLSLDLSGASGGPGGAYALDISSKFFVSEPAVMRIDYDFGANSIGAGTFLLQDLTHGTTLVHLSFAEGTTGSTTTLLLPGVEYRTSANVYAIDGAGTAFVNAFIPAPASAAAPALAGLLALRRRRT